MNFRNFLGLGKELIEGENIPEVKIRTSMGRVYNYVFHYMRENHRGHPDSNFGNGKGDHSEAINFLKRLEERRLASTLHSLTHKRNRAEYDLNLSFKKQNAIDYIEDAEDFVKKMDSGNVKTRRVKAKRKFARRK